MEKLENFNSMICHDIKNPLTEIIGFTELLKTKSSQKLDKKENKFLNYIYLLPIIEMDKSLWKAING